MLTANATLAFFVLLGISSFAIFWAKKLRLPHTVLLVIIGVVLGALSQIPVFTFVQELRLTPELLFFLLLPTLIFESAYNINARRLVEDTVPILILAVASLLASALLIATALYFLLPLIGIHLPFIISLLFGSLISATDPVAVLALFKEFGAPRRLSLIFEGESLFNDATSVAMFSIVLGIASFGFHGSETVIGGIIAFCIMMFGGVAFGLVTGGLFSKMVGATRESRVASITITIVLAHVTFILSDIISEQLVVFGQHIAISPIIATTVASLVMGNYGRAKIHPKAEEFVEELWAQLAFMANSVIFILIGILFVDIPIENPVVLTAIVLTILVVAIARSFSIYPIVFLYNKFSVAGRQLPMAWQHLLSWGSLRGALAVTMVLLIPPDLTVPGWTFDMSIREFLLSITIGCIFATLFIKATTIKSFMRKLKLDSMTLIEAMEYQEAKALVHHEVTNRVTQYHKRGYINDASANSLVTEHNERFQRACKVISELSDDDQKQLAHRVIRMFAIGIEKRYLKELYHHDEVNEAVFRRLTGKLQLQFEAVESGDLSPNMSLHTDGKDIFEHMANFIRSLYTRETEDTKIANLYMYYRAQSIVARKVLKELDRIDRQYASNIFTEEAYAHTVTLYKNFKEQSRQKMTDLQTKHPVTIEKLSKHLAVCGVGKIEEHVLHDLYERQLITPKLHITLGDEFNEAESATT